MQIITVYYTRSVNTSFRSNHFPIRIELHITSSTVEEAIARADLCRNVFIVC